MGRSLRFYLIGFFTIGVLLGGVFYAGTRGNKTQPTHTAANRATNIGAVAKSSVVQKYGRLPLLFEPNVGQADPQVKFLSRGRGYTLFLTSTEAVLTLVKDSGQLQGPDPAWSHHLAARETAGVGANLPTSGLYAQAPEPLRAEVIRMRFVGSNPTPRIGGLDEQPTKVNYFVGNDPAKWHRNISTYRTVKYGSVYPGIDLVFYGNPRGRLEYDFIVAPAADPNQIRLSVEGADNLVLDSHGNLIMEMMGGELRLLKPNVYQLVNGEERAVIANYSAPTQCTSRPVAGVACKETAFNIASHSSGFPLVIDPVLSYSTFLSGDAGGSGWGIAVDPSGNAYVVGKAAGSAFPTTPGAFQSSGATATFVAKINATGTGLIYSTFIGDSSTSGRAIAVDSSGDAYVIGSTGAGLPVTPTAFDMTFNGSFDAFATKLTSDGSDLVYSTYLGGNSWDVANGIAVDPSGSACITGGTSSGNFPVTVNAFDGLYNGGPDPTVNDIFVTKLGSSGSILHYSTFFGGNGVESGDAVATDDSGHCYVAGHLFRTSDPQTASVLPTTPGAFDTDFNRTSEGFMARFDPFASGVSSLLYSSLLNVDHAVAIELDGSGRVYINGDVASLSLGTPNAFDSSPNGGSDAYVAIFSLSGTGPSDLLYFSYVGGNGDDYADGLALDNLGNAHVTGETRSSNFPTTPDAFQATLAGCCDAFVASIDLSVVGSSGLLYSSYLGGGNTDFGRAIAVDTGGDIYLTGQTGSNDFPTTAGSFDTIHSGGGGSFWDVFVTKLASAAPHILVVPSQISYGDKCLGIPGSDTITISNVGTTDLIIGSPTGLSVPFAIGSDGCSGQTLVPSPAAGSSCTIAVEFGPTAVGSFSDSLDIPSNDPDEPNVTVNLSGTGISGEIDVSPMSLASGSLCLGNSSDQTVTVSNVHPTCNLTIGTLSSPSAPFSVVGDACSGATIAPSGTCAITVRYAPTGQVPDSDSLSIPSDDADENPVIVSLSGTGIAGDISIAPSSHNYGDVCTGTTASQSFTVSNTSASCNLVIGAVTGPSAPFSLTADACSSVLLGPSGSCLLTVDFSPTVQGSFADVINIPSDDPDVAQNPLIAPLSGNGISGADLVGSITSVTRAVRGGPRPHRVTADVQVSNISPCTGAPAGSTVALYLSSDSILDAGDTLLNSKNVGPINPGAFRTVTFREQFAANPQGQFLIAEVDFGNGIVELDETNNLASNQIP